MHNKKIINTRFIQKIMKTFSHYNIYKILFIAIYIQLSFVRNIG